MNLFLQATTAQGANSDKQDMIVILRRFLMWVDFLAVHPGPGMGVCSARPSADRSHSAAKQGDHPCRVACGAAGEMLGKGVMGSAHSPIGNYITSIQIMEWKKMENYVKIRNCSVPSINWNLSR